MNKATEKAFEQVLAGIELLKRRVAEAVERNLAEAGDARGILMSDHSRQYSELVRNVMITPSARAPGRHQLTFLDEEGLPTGHVEFDTRDEAIRSMSGEWVRNEPPYGGHVWVVEQVLS